LASKNFHRIFIQKKEMKKVVLFGLIVGVLSSCAPRSTHAYQPSDWFGYYEKSKNHHSIREWNMGKKKSQNRRSNERPQCIDSW